MLWAVHVVRKNKVQNIFLELPNIRWWWCSRGGKEDALRSRILWSIHCIQSVPHCFSSLTNKANAFINPQPQYQIAGIKTTAAHISRLSISRSILIETVGEQNDGQFWSSFFIRFWTWMPQMKKAFMFQIVFCDAGYKSEGKGRFPEKKLLFFWILSKWGGGGTVL